MVERNEKSKCLHKLTSCTTLACTEIAEAYFLQRHFPCCEAHEHHHLFRIFLPVRDYGQIRVGGKVKNLINSINSINTTYIIPYGVNNMLDGGPRRYAIVALRY